MRFFRALKFIATLRCEESIRILSESRDGEISFAERWAYRLHLIGCVPCRRFRRQIDLIRAAARKIGGGEAESEREFRLSTEARERILAAARTGRAE